MKSLLTSLCVMICAMGSATGGDNDYSFSSIPASLLKNANAVKRMEEMTFEITEGNKAKYRHKVAFTILNEQGDRWASFGTGYDKLRSIESFEGTLFDATGKKIKSLKKSDIRDESGNDDASLADDHRVKWHSFFYKVYPYTVEYEVEIRYKGTMFMPDWIPLQKQLMSVQQSKLTVISPAINPLRYKMFNYKGEPVITEDKSNKIYTWEVKDMPAQVNEYASPAWHEITTSVYMATERFVLEDYQGSNATWKDFGKFVYDLKKDRDALPDEVRQKVHQLADGTTDVKEKITRLYEFMQQNTRYVSVQLGIGGWQPYDAKYVGTKKYGDCKALSNFMYSLLKEAGIRSVYTVTNRGFDQDYLLADLPSSQFNHVILFVPLDKDTTWLECTSQTYVPGYVGGDNCNRYAVAVDENGGTLVRTPRYGLKENLQLRKVMAALNEDGMLNVKVNTLYGGVQQDNIHELINSLSKDKVKEYLHEQLDFATYDISSFDYKENKSSLPTINESLDITVSNYATITGKRLFIVPNVMTRSYRKLTADTARKYDLEVGFEYKDVDSVEIELPKGYEPEAMPQDVSLNNKFGKYNCSVKLKDNKLLYYRSIEKYSGRFPAKDYTDLVKFYDAIYKADRNKVVLVKNEKQEEKKAF
jgi:hypothetical protein